MTRRVEDQVALLDVYSRWSSLIASQRRAALHDVFLDLAWVLLILVAVVGLSAWLERLFTRLTSERRRLHTLRTMARFALRGLALLGLALVLVGPPSQVATVIGLAGAGLTVALKDFIVGFFGWFALMGRNGIRLGDWVEIKGVSGEVIEISPFHTVLLETGNWTDAGHPTGRRSPSATRSRSRATTSTSRPRVNGSGTKWSSWSPLPTPRRSSRPSARS